MIEPQVSPTLTDIQRKSPTTISLSWTELTLIEARGFVSNYTIRYYTLSESRKRQQLNAMSKTVDANVTTATIEGLDETSSYSVQISASNGAGSGVFSTPVSVPSMFVLKIKIVLFT